MAKIFLVLIIGFCLSFFSIIKEKGIKINSRLQGAGLLLLIYSMGVSIGSDPQVIKSIPFLGGKALIFALFASIGSIGVVYVVSKILIKREKK